MSQWAMISRDMAFLLLSRMSMFEMIAIARTCHRWNEMYHRFIDRLAQRYIPFKTSFLGKVLILSEIQGDIGSGALRRNERGARVVLTRASVERMTKEPGKSRLREFQTVYFYDEKKRPVNGYALDYLKDSYKPEHHKNNVQKFFAKRNESRRYACMAEKVKKKKIDAKLLELIQKTTVAFQQFIMKAITRPQTKKPTPGEMKRLEKKGARTLAYIITDSQCYYDLVPVWSERPYVSEFLVQPWCQDFIEGWLNTPLESYQSPTLDELLVKLNRRRFHMAENWYRINMEFLRELESKYGGWKTLIYAKEFIKRPETLEKLMKLDLPLWASITLHALLKHHFSYMDVRQLTLKQFLQPKGVSMAHFVRQYDKLQELACIGIFKDDRLWGRHFRYNRHFFGKNGLKYGAFLSLLDVDTFPLYYDGDQLAFILYPLRKCGDPWDIVAAIIKMAQEVQANEETRELVCMVKGAAKRLRRRRRNDDDDGTAKKRTKK